MFTEPAHAALQAFPVEAHGLTLVAVSENITFRVTDARDGAAYVLRLHRPCYHTLKELNSEQIWTRALADAGIQTPISVPAKDGRFYISVLSPGEAQRRFAGLAHWTEGELLSNVLKGDADVFAKQARFFSLGAIVASMHNQASNWRPPEDFIRHHLDSDGLMGETPFWGRFWEHPALTEAEQRILLNARQKVHAKLAELGRDNYSVIHADLHPGNVLANGNALTVIDFDDAGWGWHLYDIAVALVRYQSDPYFKDFKNAFVQGYRTHRDLAGEALALLPMFLMIRDMVTIGWLYQRPEIDASARFETLRARTVRAAAEFVHQGS